MVVLMHCQNLLSLGEVAGMTVLVGTSRQESVTCSALVPPGQEDELDLLLVDDHDFLEYQATDEWLDPVVKTMLFQLCGVDLVVEEPAVVVASLELVLSSSLERISQVIVWREVECSLAEDILEDSDGILSGESRLLRPQMLPCTSGRQT